MNRGNSNINAHKPITTLQRLLTNVMEKDKSTINRVLSTINVLL